MLRLIGGGTERDQIGSIGESIFRSRIMKFCDNRPYFSAHFLGEKFPVHDHLVNALSETIISAIFFAQIKSTLSGSKMRKDGRRYLNISVSRDDLSAMTQYPGPAYLFGVDIETERVYFVAIHGYVNKGISGLPMDFEVTSETIPILWSEVNEYWANRPTEHTSRFTII